MTEIPLFPLRSVLLPYGRMGLRVFEQRYLDLVARCLKEDEGFGVVWIRQGSEVKQPNADTPHLAQLGTCARIVDWNSQPNGLLGIVIAGSRRFRMLSSHQTDNGLHMAQVEWLDDEAAEPLPDYAQPLCDLLRQLTEHPQVARLGYRAECDSVTELTCVLTQLLPVEESIKFALLSANDAATRLEQLIALLDHLGQ